jgi:hypothetical protein
VQRYLAKLKWQGMIELHLEYGATAARTICTGWRGTLTCLPNQLSGC